jgi:hypothetical protein
VSRALTCNGIYIISFMLMAQLLSEQDIIDCVSSGQGCNGGMPESAMAYCVTKGIDTAASYPSTGMSGMYPNSIACLHLSRTRRLRV